MVKDLYIYFYNRFNPQVKVNIFVGTTSPWLGSFNFHCIRVCDMLAGSFQQREQRALQQGKTDTVKNKIPSESGP